MSIDLETNPQAVPMESSTPPSKPEAKGPQAIRPRRSARRYHRRGAITKGAREVGAVFGLTVAAGLLTVPFSGSKEPLPGPPKPPQETTAQTEPNIFESVANRFRNFLGRPQQESDRIHQQMVEKARRDGNPEIRKQREQLSQTQNAQTEDKSGS